MSYKRLDPEDFLISADSVASPTWSNNQSALSTFFTSSTQISSSTGNYYIDIYNYNPTTTSSAEIQFNIAYANKNGKGAVPYNGTTGNSPTSTIYGQMRNLLLEDENSSFMFGVSSGSNDNDFYIININRARYKEKLIPGSWKLSIENGGGDSYTLIDDSSITNIPSYIGTQRVYNIGLYDNNNISIYPGGNSTYGSYGLFFPDTSIILLNATVMDLPFDSMGFTLGTTRTYTNAKNSLKLFTQIKLGILTGEPFSMLSEETITSNYIFVRARNSEFNYSENPSFISGSTGEVIHSSYINNPQTYITSVGLYNDNNDLLAVAKLSKPLLKDFSKESLMRIKIDF